MKKKELLELLNRYNGEDQNIKNNIFEIKGLIANLKDNYNVIEDESECVSLCIEYIGVIPTALDANIVRKQFESIFALKELIKYRLNYAEKNEIRLKVYDAEVGYHIAKIERISKIRIFFIMLFAIIGISAIIFSLLNIFGDYTGDYQWIKTVGAILAALDVPIGVIFFIIEQIDDNKKDTHSHETLRIINTDDIEEMTKRSKNVTKSISKTTNKVCGFGNSVGNNISGDYHGKL